MSHLNSLIGALQSLDYIMGSSLTDEQKRLVILDISVGLPPPILCHGAGNTREITMSRFRAALASLHVEPENNEHTTTAHSSASEAPQGAEESDLQAQAQDQRGTGSAGTQDGIARTSTRTLDVPPQTKAWENNAYRNDSRTPSIASSRSPRKGRMGRES